MTKQDIIRIVCEIESGINPNDRSRLFAKETEKNDNNDNNDNNESIGSGQFRDIAMLCRSAECYEEMEMLIRYNMAKCNSGQSWMFNCGKKCFGDMVIDGMEKIKEADEANTLANLELYFGYLYWKARILAAKSERK